MKRAIIAVLLLLAPTVSATPDAATWLRNLFLGFDQNHYYCLEIKRVQPGSHYLWNESVSMVQRNNRGEETERIPLRVISYRDENADNTGTITHSLKGDFNQEKYLSEHQVFYAWPYRESLTRPYDWSLSDRGLFLGSKERRVLMISTLDLEKIYPDIKGFFPLNPEDSRLSGNRLITEKYLSEKHLYLALHLGGGENNIDEWEAQIIVPISQQKLRNTLNELSQRQ